MTDTSNESRSRQVGTEFIPVADQDRALKFYLDKLGFEKRADVRYGEDRRWIEVGRPGAANTIALVAPNEGKGGENQTHFAFATERPLLFSAVFFLAAAFATAVFAVETSAPASFVASFFAGALAFGLAIRYSCFYLMPGAGRPRPHASASTRRPGRTGPEAKIA